MFKEKPYYTSDIEKSFYKIVALFRKHPERQKHTGCIYCSYTGCCWRREKYGEHLGHWIWTVEYSFSIFKKHFGFKAIYRKLTALDYSKITDAVVVNIDTRDYPDFCDAYIESATYKGREMTERELERLNEDGSYIYNRVLERIY